MMYGFDTFDKELHTCLEDRYAQLKKFEVLKTMQIAWGNYQAARHLRKI